MAILLNSRNVYFTPHFTSVCTLNVIIFPDKRMYSSWHSTSVCILHVIILLYTRNVHFIRQYYGTAEIYILNQYFCTVQTFISSVFLHSISVYFNIIYVQQKCILHLYLCTVEIYTEFNNTSVQYKLIKLCNINA